MINRVARVLSIGGIALGMLAVAGCTDPGGTPEPTVTVTVTATPEPGAPSSEPDYGFTFFEEAQLGSTWSEMSTQLHYPVGGIEECPWYGALWNTELATTYAYTDHDNPNGLGSTMFYTNRLLAPEGASFPRNAEGVGVGSTMAELLAAYPDAVVGTHNDLGAGDLDTVTVDDPDSDSKYVFAFSLGNSTVDLLQWGPDAGGQWSHLCTGF